MDEATNMTVDSEAPAGSAAAAILMMLLEEGEAAAVLGQLDPEEVQHLGGAMYGVADVTESQISGVLDLFVDKARSRTTLGGFGAERQIRGMMEKALGADRAETVISRIAPPQKASSLAALKWMDAQTIAAMVEAEHPQLIALVLTHLEAPIAADVLGQLDEQIQADVVYRVATMGPVTAEAIADLEWLLMKPVKRSPAAQTKRGGATEAAQIMNNSRKAAEQRIIKALQKLDKNLARSIEDEMFVFDNLMALDDKGLGAVLRAVESDTLVVALKGADERMRTRFYGCMSARAAQSIQDEIADRGPMRLAEVQEAQRDMLNAARKLAAEGTINIGKDDDYV
ncbi:flagellar motor switch protein FliG [Sphingomonas naphthae]